MARLLGIVFSVIIFAGVYVTNFVQMLTAISDEAWTIAIIKAIGVCTLLGSIFTIWF